MEVKDRKRWSLVDLGWNPGPGLHLAGTFLHLSSSVVVQSLSPVQLFVTLWTAACQASLSFTISHSLLKFKSIESVMPSNHLILCCPLLLLPSLFPGIRVFPNESALRIRWSQYWSFSRSRCPDLLKGEGVTFLHS